MTTQHQIIAICVIAFTAVPLGTFVTIKLIKKLSRAPVNTLVRSGDIELVDYIEPTRPQGIYNYDLFQPTYERVGSMPPSYHTVDRWYISSWSESAINLDFLIIFVCLIILIIIFKLKLSNTNSRTVFTEGISTEIITFRNDYQQLLSSKLNKGDQGFFINYGEVHKEILKHGWSEEDIKVWLESLNEQDYNVTIEILSDISPIHPQWKMFSTEFIVNYNSNYTIIAFLINDHLLNLYKSTDIYTNYTVIIHYAPLTKSDFSFSESYFRKRNRR